MPRFGQTVLIRLLAIFALTAPFVVRYLAAPQNNGPQMLSIPARGFPVNNGYPSLARGQSGDLWLAWMERDVADPNRRGSDKDLILYDHIVVKRQNGQGWSKAIRVSGDLALNSDPTVVAESGGAWVFWSRNLDGQYDLMGRHIGADLSMCRPLQLTRRFGANAMPKAMRAPDGAVWLVWESSAQAISQIYAMVYREGHWSQPEPISDERDNSFRPALAISDSGVVGVAWDGDGKSRYEVYLRQWKGGRWDAIQALPSSSGLDAYAPKVAALEKDRIWVTFAENPKPLADWGLRGRQLDPKPRPRVGAVLWNGSQWMTAPGVVATNADMPDIAASQSGAVEIVFLRLKSHLNFRLAVTRLGPRGWTEPEELGTGEDEYQHYLMPGAPKARIDQHPSLAVAGNKLLIAYERGTGWGKDRQIALRELEFGDAPERNAPYNLLGGVFGGLKDDVPRAPASLGGYHVYFGDIHNHLLMDDGWTGTTDQFYRFAYERRELDFAAYTPHAESNKLLGSEVASVERIAAVSNIPDRFVAIPGWEWTQGDFNVPREGHKHILKEEDRQPFFSALEATSASARQLAALMKHTRSIMFSHHVARGATGGVNFDAIDPSVEPDVEITSQWGRFEYFHNPGATKDEVSGSSVQNAWRKGLRIGVVGGSDNHDLFFERGTALTAVIAGDLTRQSIFEALRARHCYATTGEKILLDVRVNGALMGSEISAGSPPVVSVKVKGTDLLEKVEVVKFWSGAPDPFPAVYAVTPGAKGTEFQWKDLEFHENSGYYIRVTQHADPRITAKKDFGGATSFPNEMAWSSPIWVDRR